MKTHPFTPMNDANLVRVPSRQTGAAVGCVDMEHVRKGTAAIAARYAGLRANGNRYAIVDAINNTDLLAIGTASAVQLPSAIRSKKRKHTGRP